MNLSLNRVILFVQHVGQLKKFYQRHFHLELLEEIEDEWVVLKAGNCEIGLHKIGEAYKNAGTNAPGENSNVKLVFETDMDLLQLREGLIQNGVVMKEIKSFGSTHYLYCDGADLEGNVFQIMHRIF